MHRRLFTAAWIAWVLTFAVLEGGALVSHFPNGTLSANVWSLLDVSPVLWWLGLGGFAWLALHWFARKRRRWF